MSRGNSSGGSYGSERGSERGSISNGKGSGSNGKGSSCSRRVAVGMGGVSAAVVVGQYSWPW